MFIKHMDLLKEPASCSLVSVENLSPGKGTSSSSLSGAHRIPWEPSRLSLADGWAPGQIHLPAADFPRPCSPVPPNFIWQLICSKGRHPKQMFSKSWWWTILCPYRRASVTGVWSHAGVLMPWLCFCWHVTLNKWPIILSLSFPLSKMGMTIIALFGDPWDDKCKRLSRESGMGQAFR